MQVYQGTFATVGKLIDFLQTLSMDTSIEIGINTWPTSGVEVWYDEDTKTIILK